MIDGAIIPRRLTTLIANNYGLISRLLKPILKYITAILRSNTAYDITIPPNCRYFVECTGYTYHQLINCSWCCGQAKINSIKNSVGHRNGIPKLLHLRNVIATQWETIMEICVGLDGTCDHNRIYQRRNMAIKIYQWNSNKTARHVDT